MKVVLDTNLFVAAYWNRSSSSAKIIEMCLSGQVQAVCTEQIARELRMVMRTIRARPEYAARVQHFLETAIFVEPIQIELRTEDPEDQKFLECAAGAGAEYLVTSDEHLLRMRRLGLSGIVKPSAFLREMERQS